MKIIVFLLLCLNLFAFEAKKTYQCIPKYTIANGNPQEYPQEEQEKKTFYLIFNKDLTRIKTSDGIIYNQSTTNVKGKLYRYKKMVNGRAITYKLRTASTNGLYRSAHVTGYGNLINEYVMCLKVKKTKKTKSKNTINE
ncbi:hypothetical protein JHD50_06880 [Sulfurimonas sp. MAG313]|nr:hypothetical protein [Sulfurimonas sp. MAG313]MDF1881030.1 hypothetical protein [Sulfurimonas sp. MAG313]